MWAWHTKQNEIILLHMFGVVLMDFNWCLTSDACPFLNAYEPRFVIVF